MGNTLGLLNEADIRQLMMLIESLEHSTFDFLQLEMGDLKVTIGKGDAPLPADAPIGAVKVAPSVSLSAEVPASFSDFNDNRTFGVERRPITGRRIRNNGSASWCILCAIRTRCAAFCIRRFRSSGRHDRRPDRSHEDIQCYPGRTEWHDHRDLRSKYRNGRICAGVVSGSSCIARDNAYLLQ